MMQPVGRAFAKLRESGQLCDLGALQGVISNIIGASTSDLQPALGAVTRLLFDTRDNYVKSLGNEDFLALLKAEKPHLLEITSETDCDEDGNPDYDGPELMPQINVDNLNLDARSAFLKVAGFGFAKGLPVNLVDVDAVEELTVSTALAFEKELVAAWLKSKAEFSVVPMVHIPRV